jgi:hypothetical protein
MKRGKESPMKRVLLMLSVLAMATLAIRIAGSPPTF